MVWALCAGSWLQISYTVHLPLSPQKHEAAARQYETDRLRVEQEERRKTLAAETKEHQQRSQYQDQLARRRYDDQLVQQVQFEENCMHCTLIN